MHNMPKIGANFIYYESYMSASYSYVFAQIARATQVTTVYEFNHTNSFEHWKHRIFAYEIVMHPHCVPSEMIHSHESTMSTVFLFVEECLHGLRVGIIAQIGGIARRAIH